MLLGSHTKKKPSKRNYRQKNKNSEISRKYNKTQTKFRRKKRTVKTLFVGTRTDVQSGTCSWATASIAVGQFRIDAEGIRCAGTTADLKKLVGKFPRKSSFQIWEIASQQVFAKSKKIN
jgi:hypothetical protein